MVQDDREREREPLALRVLVAGLSIGLILVACVLLSIAGLWLAVTVAGFIGLGG